MKESYSKPKSSRTLRVGCIGCLIYIVLFGGVGSLILYFDFNSMLSIPIIGVYVLGWLYFFIQARKKDQQEKENNGE